MSNLLSNNDDLHDYVQIFEKLDKNKDGYISFPDMKEALSKFPQY